MGIRFVVTTVLAALWSLGCSPGGGGAFGADDGKASAGGDGGGGASFAPTNSGGSGELCGQSCSSDLHSIVDCHGQLVEECLDGTACDLETISCVNACAAAVSNKQSVGCEYYATFMDQLNANACFAAFVANTWNTAAHITIEYDGAALDPGAFGYLPVGSGPTLTYEPYDSSAGLQPGEVVILFLGGPDGTSGPVCPMPSAVPSGAVLSDQSGIGNSFRIQTNVPVVAYQINPYGGGKAAVTGASLLLPTSAWDTNYIGLNAYEGGPHPTSLNIVAMEDDTTVTMVPVVDVVGGGGLPAGSANVPLNFTLSAGQHAQFTQVDALSGSVLDADKPIGFMAGHRCVFIPTGTYACDHGEQMIPPIRALGNEYVGVMHKPREPNEPAVWHLVGAVDGTTLSYSNPVGGPATLQLGEIVEWQTSEPFVVTSQDEDHPFLLISYMAGGSWVAGNGVGDSDFVISVPPAQYMASYVFFADPTYPMTNLVLVRGQKDGGFHDVTLDCAGVVSGWQPVGDYEYTRVDLIDLFNPVGGCSTGRHEISSDAPFGLWVWGWGTPQTTPSTQYVSYGYPGGMNVQPINTVVVPPVPK